MRFKRVSKKSKKSWRKNVNVKDVEDYLDDVRLEERLGGPVEVKLDKDLFTIDKQQADDTKSVEQSVLKTNKKHFDANEVKCYKYLKPLQGAGDPFKKRNVVKRKPALPSRQSRRIMSGMLKNKDIQSAVAKFENQMKEKFDGKHPLMPKFQSDLWDEDCEGKDLVKAAKVAKTNLKKTSAEWLADNVKKHVLEGEKNFRVKEPKSLRNFTSKLKAIIAPHPGASYNPTFDDHQQLLSTAAEIELEKQRKENKSMALNAHAFTKMTNETKAAIYMSEMMNGLEAKGAIKIKEELSDSEEETTPAIVNKPVTDADRMAKSKRKKMRQLKLELASIRRRKAARKRFGQFYRLKELKKELEAKALSLDKRRKKRAEKEKHRIEYEALQLSRYKYEEPEPEVNLACDISGSLRQIKQEGNLLLDRYKSLQKRNITETRIYQNASKPAKRKIFTKKSHVIHQEEIDSYIQRVEEEENGAGVVLC